MRKINKGTAPQSLTKWKRKNPDKTYHDLKECSSVKQDIRIACTKEQHFLCAYCCKRISGQSSDTVNEHVEPQAQSPEKSLDFNNIVASCRTQGQCDNSHGSQVLSLTPLMNECETELSFRLTGEVRGVTDRAEQIINILNLNNRKLCETRKQIAATILLTEGLLDNESNPVDVEDDELLLSVSRDICTVDSEGKMQAFAPVIKNIIQNWLQEA